jgi:hypothetical protein
MCTTPNAATGAALNHPPGRDPRTADHQAHHAQERRLELCSRHGTPYDRRDRWGRPRCRKCQAEATARWRRRHPEKQRPLLTDEQRRRHNERGRLRRTMPEGGAKARAREKAKRQPRAAGSTAA